MASESISWKQARSGSASRFASAAMRAGSRRPSMPRQDCTFHESRRMMPVRRDRMRAWLVILAFTATAGLAQDKPEETLSAVVAINARALADARSNATLGQQRRGSGVLIDKDYALTIGYLVIEAETIEVTGADGKTVPATLAGYDHASGFGLLKLVAPLAGKPLPLGDSAALGEREPALVATSPGREGAS